MNKKGFECSVFALVILHHGLTIMVLLFNSHSENRGGGGGHLSNWVSLKIDLELKGSAFVVF